MTNQQKIQEFEKLAYPYVHSNTFPERDVEYLKILSDYFLSVLQSKDQEKEKALIEQESNFLNQKANQHDQAVREKALQKVKSAAKKVLDELEYTQFIMALEDEFEINIDN